MHKAATHSIGSATPGAPLYGPWSVALQQIDSVVALPEVGSAFTRQAETYERAIPDIVVRTTNTRASCSSFPRTLSSVSFDGETIASTAALLAASAASVAATAANSSRRRGAAACIGRSGAPAGAFGKATWVASSGGRSDGRADPAGVASSGEVCGGTGSVIVEASHFEGG